MIQKHTSFAFNTWHIFFELILKFYVTRAHPLLIYKNPFAKGIKEDSQTIGLHEAINFLNSRPKEPFFIFLPLTKPHPPYSAPEPFYSSIDEKDVPDLRPHGLKGKPDYHKLIRQYRNITSLDEAFFKKLHAVYLGSVSYTDFLYNSLNASIAQF